MSLPFQENVDNLDPIDKLSNLFGLNGQIKFSYGLGGLLKANLHLPLGSSFEIYFHGAHVTSFKTEFGRELLFVSKNAVFSQTKAIRGGIPVIFPQFGPGILPQHGFARDNNWEVHSTGGGKHEVHITLQLKDTEATRKVWPHSFTAKLTTSIIYDEDHKQSRLHQQLVVTNCNATENFQFTTALHTYFSISNIHTTTVSPVKDLWYTDKTTNSLQQQVEDKIIFTGETDRAYYNAPTVLIVDDASDPTLQIVLEKKNFVDAVVWNIWSERIKSMSDFSPEDWKNYVCVEVGNIGEPVSLPPNESWVASQIIGVKSKKSDLE